MPPTETEPNPEKPDLFAGVDDRPADPSCQLGNMPPPPSCQLGDIYMLPTSQDAHVANLARSSIQEVLKETKEEEEGGVVDDIPRGAIIGRVFLEGCHPAEGVRGLLDDYAEAMGNYDDGRFAWDIRKPELFGTPIPYRGQQGFFNVPSRVLEAAGIETGII